MTPAQRQLDRVRLAAEARLASAVDLATRICEIPAPTGHEHARADHVAHELRSRGYAPEIDDIGNVYTIRGERDGPALMLVAHTDTVFPAGAIVDVTRDGDNLRGAGVGDNSLGVAAMIEALSLLDDLGISGEADIIAVANVGEEGLGNLRGVRAAVDRFEHRIGAVIAVEGHNLGRVTHAGVGSLRWKLSVTGPGGHSWGAFGNASAIHGIARVIARIADVQVPTDPKTTFNVGIINGGVSINTIAPDASALIDMRSIDPDALQRLASEIQGIISDEVGDGLRAHISVLGERPAGSCPLDAPIVQLAGSVLQAMGITPVFDASSTDANIPISRGIPAICIGITHGGFAHTTEEFIEIPPIAKGIEQLAHLSIGAMQIVSTSRS